MLLKVSNLGFRYGKGDWIFRHIDFEVDKGERVGIVAPSGHGKTTLSKILAGYEKHLEGEVVFNNKSIGGSGYNPIQLIYQHPEKAINPRWKMEDVLMESGNFDNELIKELGIEEEWLKRYPRELSGGELQRFCVARALDKRTEFLIADEISTMLDVITQAQIWNVVLRECEKRELGMVIVTHNNALASRVCSRIISL